MCRISINGVAKSSNSLSLLLLRGRLAAGSSRSRVCVYRGSGVELGDFALADLGHTFESMRAHAKLAGGDSAEPSCFLWQITNFELSETSLKLFAYILLFFFFRHFSQGWDIPRFSI